jgi:hypothetical protein
MKTFFAVVGAFVVIALIAGNVGLCDFRLCIGAVGSCNVHSAVATNQRGGD